VKRQMVMRRVAGGLFPVGDDAWTVLETIKQQQDVIVSVKTQRNAPLLGLYWALASAVAESDPGFDDREDADHWVRMQIPWMRSEYSSENGKVTARPRSIAEDEMPQEEFSRFFDRASELWAERLNTSVEDLLAESRLRAAARRVPGGDGHEQD